MKKLIFLSIIVGLIGFLWATPARAINIGFVPSSQSVLPGDSLSVDIFVSGLGAEIVSAYDLDITYEPTILSAIWVTFGSELGFPLSLQSFDLTTSGLVDLKEVSLLPDASLVASQPDSFTLASLGFEALKIGESSLAFVFDAFNDVKGLKNRVLTLDVGGGNVTVTPEPCTMLLLGFGLVGLAGAAARRKFKKKELVKH